MLFRSVSQSRYQMKLWGGRFSDGIAKSAELLSRSVDFDYRLAKYDIAVNLVHVRSLEQNGVIEKAESEKIQKALKKIGQEIVDGNSRISESDEDIHSVIERRMIEELPDLGSVIRTGRSRNDLVATDFKLYLMESMNTVALSLSQLANVANEQAISMAKVS